MPRCVNLCFVSKFFHSLPVYRRVSVIIVRGHLMYFPVRPWKLQPLYFRKSALVAHPGGVVFLLFHKTWTEIICNRPFYWLWNITMVTGHRFWRNMYFPNSCVKHPPKIWGAPCSPQKGQLTPSGNLYISYARELHLVYIIIYGTYCSHQATSASGIAKESG